MFFPTRPARPPGSRCHAQIQLEILSIDGNALARGIRDKITEAELRAAYENRKAEFQERSELPNDLFAGQPELTPPVIRPFADVRTQLALALAEERAQAEIIDQVHQDQRRRPVPVLREAMPQAVEEIEEAKKQGTKPKTELPAALDLKELAERERLEL